MIAVIRFPWAPGPAAPIRICGEEPEKHGVRAESRGDSPVGINKFTEPLGEHQLAESGTRCDWELSGCFASSAGRLTTDPDEGKLAARK